MNKDIENILKYLRLRGLLNHWDNYIKYAAKHNFSHTRFLEYILQEEYKLKLESARNLRMKRAGIPQKLIIETFPFSRQPKLNKKMILSIYDSFDYMTNKQNIIWLGPTGVGKSGLATAFLIQAIDKGYTGLYISFPELVNQLYQSVADHTENEVIKKFANYDCIHIDEVGYVEVEPVQVGLFFTLMQKRHKCKTTLITSNLGFSEWSSFLKNIQLTAALIDRLTENSYVINMKDCVSLRTKLK